DPGPWADRKGESGCGRCKKCLAVCPVDAIKEDPADFDSDACKERIKQFEKIRGIGQRICGICVRACGGPAGIRDE
ncbi:MAG: 4Fe-4S binding protein, partial [bacterium]